MLRHRLERRSTCTRNHTHRGLKPLNGAVLGRRTFWCRLMTCCSTGQYDLTEAEGVRRGTKIVIHLKGDSYDFCKEEKVKGIGTVNYVVLVLRVCRNYRKVQ